MQDAFKGRIDSVAPHCHEDAETNWDRASRRLMPVCDGSGCSKKEVAPTKQDVIGIVQHAQRCVTRRQLVSEVRVRNQEVVKLDV